MSELIACHHKVTLDIAKRDVCTIEVVNRDTANILEVNVCENGKEVSLENATLVTITYSNDTVDEMQISEDFKTAFIRINANCLKRGINFAKVCIYSGDNGLITAEMLTINCKQTVGSDNPAVPDPDMPKLKEMIEELVKQSASSEQIAAAVSQYLEDNPIIETDPTVPAWAKEKNKPTYTAAEVGALSGGTLDAAINEALTAAKASGEFDGAGGITPTIGDNGNWFLGDTDTGKPSRGEKGDKGATGATGADGKSAYSYAQDDGYTGTEEEFAAKLAAEKLPNPYPLTFTGAVNETYDGSSAKTIEIPSGGGSGESGLGIYNNYDVTLISFAQIDQATLPIDAGIVITEDDNGNSFSYDGVVVWTDIKSGASYTDIDFNNVPNVHYPIQHGVKDSMNMYIVDGTSMRAIVGLKSCVYIRQTRDDVNAAFYPDPNIARLPEKITAIHLCPRNKVKTGTFYKIWGLTKK